MAILSAREPCRFVAYLRVSTEGQGRSGLGLEAQRQAVATYLAQSPHRLKNGQPEERKVDAVLVS
jgi:DNA invertase Pin-like site-specific DNA recombinase